MQQPLKYPGGKHYLRKEIWRLAPPHTFRVIGCAGGLGEFWDWPADGVAECVNDRDELVYNLYAVLSRPDLFEQFHRIVQMTPFGRQFWDEAGKVLKKDFPPLPSPELAAHYMVRVRMSMMGLRDSFAPLSQARLRRGMMEQASAWMTVVDDLPECHERMRRVAVENLPLISLLDKYDRPDNWHYIDPPYYPGTREDGLYRVEMSAEEHHEMLERLLRMKSRVLLSGYSCPVYQEALKDWSVKVVARPNSMQKSKEKSEMSEYFWANYPLPEGDAE